MVMPLLMWKPELRAGIAYGFLDGLGRWELRSSEAVFGPGQPTLIWVDPALSEGADIAPRSLRVQADARAS